MKNLQSKFVAVNPHRCEACWQCVEACPKQVIGKINLWVHKHVYIEHPSACIGCKKCIRVCPHDAIRERKTSAQRVSE